MGAEAGEGTQKLKRAAAAAYDYERDPKWADYWSNILIPPRMASRSDVIDHFKRKFYQRYIDPGLAVEPMSMNASSHPSRQTTQSSSASASAGDQSRSRSTGSSTRSAGSSATPPPNPTGMRWDQHTIQFAVSAWVFVLALLAIFPLIPRNISNRTYRLAFMGTAGSSLYSVYSVHGKPGSWNMQAIQLWLQSIIATKDFIYLGYSLMFLTSHLCLKFALLPILCRSLEHVAKFLRRNFTHSNLYRKFLEEPCVWVESNTTTLSILSSHAEVGLGFLLILSLLSWQRNIIQTFIYWQLLKLMYHAPVTAGYHQSVWAKIGRSIYPAVHRYAPFLNTPLGVIQRWWFR